MMSLANAARRRRTSTGGTAAGLAALLLLMGVCTGADGDTAAAGSSPSASASPSPSSPTSSTSAVEPAADTSGAVRGLPSVPDYPITVAASGLVPGEREAGAISYRDAEGRNVVTVHAVHTLAGVPSREVPPDVAAFLRQQRSELLVTEVRAVEQSGIPAQRFRLAVRPGHTPSDLWAVAGNRYKPLATWPMEVVAVRSSRGLVWLWTEWEPANEKAALARFDDGLSRVTVR